jgi:DNA-3-methyladenine glycosylase I
MTRCEWCLKTPQEMNYHDNEWGVPLHDDRKLFEFMVLDAFQAGLSWRTVLLKRENFRDAFDNFNANKIILYDDIKFNELMNNAGIVRNKQKINSAIINANKFLELQAKYGTFDAFIWKFTDSKPIVNSWKNIKEVPPKTEISDKMSKELVQLGFKFVGSTICYAFMQAAGMVNDHIKDCFRYEEINMKYEI